MQSSAFYNKFFFLYPLIDLFLTPQKKVLLQCINSYPVGNLLEIGVGNGSHFHGYKAHTVTGIDTSEAMLKVAGTRVSTNIKLFCMSGEALSFNDGVFDYVVLSHVVAVVDDPERLLNEVSRVLKSGGLVFILNHITPDNWLRYLDKGLSGIAKLFHFRSAFHLENLMDTSIFSLQKKMNLGIASYFKLFIYQKK